MIINHNLLAMNSHRQLGITAGALSKSTEKMSSGLRINRAGDDAAGLAISEKMRGQIRGLNQASRNAQDGISMIQTAEGALTEVHDILGRIRELANQSANGTYTTEDRQNLQDEVTQLTSEIDRIGNTTDFNTMKLLNGNLKATGGASVGLDTTTGAFVADLTTAEINVADIAGAEVASADFIEEEITVDGVTIDIDWSSLTSDEKAIIYNLKGSATYDTWEQGANLIIEKINEAIDEKGANIEHVTGYVKSSGEFVIESGSEGSESYLKIGDTGVIGKLFGSSAKSGVASAVFTGIVIADAAMDMYVDDTLIRVSIAQKLNDERTIEGVAELLQQDINDNIENYNSLMGKTQGEDGFINDINVSVVDGGRLAVASEDGALRFVDLKGGDVAINLGLNEAQTEAAGNGGMVLQIGANRSQTIQFGINDMRTASLGMTTVNISTQSQASTSLSKIDAAIQSVSGQRSELGAVQNRLEHTVTNVNTTSENLQASESRIRDVDMAKEMMEFTKSNILQQAAQAMLAQANQVPQGVLQLLR